MESQKLSFTNITGVNRSQSLRENKRREGLRLRFGEKIKITAENV